MKKKLSVPLITKTPPEPKDKLFWGSDAHGLDLKITPAGRRIYVFQYSRNNRTRRVTIGKHGSEFTLHEARSRARDLAHTVANSGDPAAEIRRAKSIPTIEEFGPIYLERHAYIVSELVKEKAWDGPAKELLDLLNIGASEETKRSRTWPKTPQAMGMLLVRICPVLRRLG